jgi:hypothetical protein
MPWETDKEKLLCFMVLNDDVSKRLSSKAGTAYWRAFVVQDRMTGEISTKFRFKYQNGDRSWFRIGSRVKGSSEEIVKDFVDGISQTLLLGASLFEGIDISSYIECFYPPDDGGDPNKTIEWLEKEDLIEVTRTEIKGDPN